MISLGLAFLSALPSALSQPHNPILDWCSGWTCTENRTVRMRVARPSLLLGDLRLNRASSQADLDVRQLPRVPRRNTSNGHFLPAAQLPIAIRGIVPLLVVESRARVARGSALRCTATVQVRERIIQPARRWREGQWVTGMAGETTHLFYEFGTAEPQGGSGVDGFTRNGLPPPPPATLHAWQIYPQAPTLETEFSAFLRHYRAGERNDAAGHEVGLLRSTDTLRDPDDEGALRERAIDTYTRANHPDAPCIDSDHESYLRAPLEFVSRCRAGRPAPLSFAVGGRAGNRFVGALLNLATARSFAESRFVEMTAAAQSGHPRDETLWTQRFRGFLISSPSCTAVPVTEAAAVGERALTRFYHYEQPLIQLRLPPPQIRTVRSAGPARPATISETDLSAD